MVVMRYYTDDILLPLFRKVLDDKNYVLVKNCMHDAPNVEVIPKNYIKDYINKSHDVIRRNNLQVLLESYDRHSQ